MEGCRHDVHDSSGRQCALCKKCLHRDITVVGACATCQGLRQDVRRMVNVDGNTQSNIDRNVVGLRYC